MGCLCSKALSIHNIVSGFKVTGIYPMNEHAMDFKMGPSELYERRTAGQTKGNTDRHPSTE